VRSGEVGDQPDAAAEGPEAFYRAHADALTKFATSLVGPSDADDVVANAVAKTLAGPRTADQMTPHRERQ